MIDQQGFSTTRLKAVPASADHAETLARALANPLIHLWIRDTVSTQADFRRQFGFVANLPHGRSPDGAEIWLTWTLFLRADPAHAIGYVQSTIREPEKVTIAYVFGRAYWRRGYAREAVTTMLDWVFSHYDLAVAVAEVDTRNIISMAFAEALGMRHVTTTHGAGVLRGAPYEDHFYYITRADWLAHAA